MPAVVRPAESLTVDAPPRADAGAPTAARRLRGIAPWLGAMASGGLLTLAFAPWNQSWLAWVGLIPLLAGVWWTASVSPRPAEATGAGRARRMLSRIWQRPGARGAALGYVGGLVFFWGVFGWLRVLTWIAPVAVLGWFLLAFLFAGYWATWGWFVARMVGIFGIAAGAPGARRVVRTRWNLGFALPVAAAWVALEWLRGWLLSGWGWNTLGSAMHGNIALIQLAEWTGVGGLSFLAAWANVIGALTIRRFYLEIVQQRENLRVPLPSLGLLPVAPARRAGIRPHFDFTLTLAGLFAVFAHGYTRLEPFGRPPGPGEGRLRIAAVQPAIPQTQKWDRRSQSETFATLERLSGLALASRPQLLLWPEAATPQGFLIERDNFELVNNIARRGGFHFLLGTIDSVPDPEDDGRPGLVYNAAALLAPGGIVENVGPPAQVYYKQHLVPFGEYLPLRREFPPMDWIAGRAVPGDIAKGSRPIILQMQNPDVRLAPLICFEDTLGDLVRGFVRPQVGADGERQPGAQVLVNLTNDAWFLRSAASEQQLAEAVFRAVENRRPLVRCANTGVTCVVDRFGRIQPDQILRGADGGTFAPGFLVTDVTVPAVDAPLTFYTRHGELFSILCAGLAGALALRMLLAPVLRRATTAGGKPGP